MKEPAKFFDDLIKRFKYKLKGVGEPEYHLGGNFWRDKNGILCWGAKSYVQKMLGNFERMFGSLPTKKYSSPMDKEDHPELDQTSFLDAEGIKKYQSLIGALQWVITLGRFDVAVSIMTMSRFLAEPREGHMDHVKRIYGYLQRFPDAATRFRVGVPVNETLFEDMPEHDWMYSVYGQAKEDILEQWPKPKGKVVRMSTFKDANLGHCKVTGKSITGIVHFVMQTPVEWFLSCRVPLRWLYFGSEFVAARIAAEQTMAMRYTLMAIGVPARRNKLVIRS